MGGFKQCFHSELIWSETFQDESDSFSDTEYEEDITEDNVFLEFSGYNASDASEDEYSDIEDDSFDYDFRELSAEDEDVPVRPTLASASRNKINRKPVSNTINAFSEIIQIPHFDDVINECISAYVIFKNIYPGLINSSNEKVVKTVMKYHDIFSYCFGFRSMMYAYKYHTCNFFRKHQIFIDDSSGILKHTYNTSLLVTSDDSVNTVRIIVKCSVNALYLRITAYFRTISYIYEIIKIVLLTKLVIIIICYNFLFEDIARYKLDNISDASNSVMIVVFIKNITIITTIPIIQPKFVARRK